MTPGHLDPIWNGNANYLLSGGHAFRPRNPPVINAYHHVRLTPRAMSCAGMIAIVLLAISGCDDRSAAGPASPPPALSAPGALPPAFTNSVGMRLLHVSGGTFSMGSPSGNPDAAFAPPHAVTVSSYYLSQTEVTKGQFRQFVTATSEGRDLKELMAPPTGPWMDRYRHNDVFMDGPDDSFPMYAIDWRMACDFCAWLSAREGHRYRLPTEAEWEYAARAGTTTDYWWGRDPNELGWGQNERTRDGRPYGNLYPSGSLPANPWGFHEILGNASEWTADWYDPTYYRHSPNQNPTGPEHGLPDGMKTIRGGAFWWSSETSTTYFRQPSDSAGRHAGLRVLCEIDPTLKVPLDSPPSVLPETLRREAAAAAKIPHEHVTIAPGVDLEFVAIPSGSVVMGSPVDELGHGPMEEPRTTVHITRPFLMGVYEVTQAQYEAVMGENPSAYKDPLKPVLNVNASDVSAFCKKLMQQERAAGRLAVDALYRLPTEAEFEYVCRAGADDRQIQADQEWRSHQIVCDRRDGPERVGSKTPNRWGLYDLLGNAMEWVAGGVAKYPGGVQDDWSATAHGFLGCRGGAWCFLPIACRPAMRHAYAAEVCYPFMGFRLVRTYPGDDEYPFQRRMRAEDERRKREQQQAQPKKP